MERAREPLKIDFGVLTGKIKTTKIYKFESYNIHTQKEDHYKRTERERRPEE